VHRRDAARAAGPPPAQAAASGVGRRSRRDASGIPPIQPGASVRLCPILDLSISGCCPLRLSILHQLRGCWCCWFRVRRLIYRIEVFAAVDLVAVALIYHIPRRCSLFVRSIVRLICLVHDGRLVWLTLLFFVRYIIISLGLTCLISTIMLAFHIFLLFSR